VELAPADVQRDAWRMRFVAKTSAEVNAVEHLGTASSSSNVNGAIAPRQPIAPDRRGPCKSSAESF